MQDIIRHDSLVLGGQSPYEGNVSLHSLHCICRIENSDQLKEKVVIKPSILLRYSKSCCYFRRYAEACPKQGCEVILTIFTPSEPTYLHNMDVFCMS